MCVSVLKDMYIGPWADMCHQPFHEVLDAVCCRCGMLRQAFFGRSCCSVLRQGKRAADGRQSGTA